MPVENNTQFFPVPLTYLTSPLPAAQRGAGTTSPGISVRGQIPSKRNACTVCRKSKLRCDGESPSCGRCTRLKHDCTYEDNRRKSGPRRGYIKDLEARLAQLEGLLAKQEANESSGSAVEGDASGVISNDQFHDIDFDITSVDAEVLADDQNTVPDVPNLRTQFGLSPALIGSQIPGAALTNDDYSWAMIELGVDEPLPPQETIDELNKIYFDKVHPSTPIIHQYRFLAAMSLAPYARPLISLRYAMWTLAASISEKYKNLHPIFYVRARKYAEADEMTGRFRYINVRHAQSWILIGIYEFKMMHFPHAWLTTGRATRLTQMMGLSRLDGLGMDVKQTLPIPLDWSEKEERRRTFWMAFCMDRYASSGTGWPMIINEKDIMTNLPSSDEAFAGDEEVPGMSFNEAMNPANAPNLSAFAGVAVIASLSGRILEHLQRPSVKKDDHDLNGEFWKEHRKMDSILLNTSLCLPSHLRLPVGLSNPNKIFLNISLQSATICLHQAAIFKAEKHELSASIISESKDRCFMAAKEICSIMKMIAHMDLSVLNVYTPFTLYVATRIYAQASKSQPDDDDARSSVRFLLSALVALKEAIPLVESYLVQLDLEGYGLATLQDNVRWDPGLEKSVAEMSLKEKLDDSSWVTFVSPLVRIVEQKDESLSPSETPSEDPQGLSRPSPSSDEPTATAATISPDSRNYPDLPTVATTSESMCYFPPTATWETSGTGFPADVFDSLMDMETNSWEQTR